MGYMGLALAARNARYTLTVLKGSPAVAGQVAAVKNWTCGGVATCCDWWKTMLSGATGSIQVDRTSPAPASQGLLLGVLSPTRLCTSNHTSRDNGGYFQKEGR
ncbi:hypothetical protein WAI453_012040 [Rhynchosporium graminicola]